MEHMFHSYGTTVPFQIFSSGWPVKEEGIGKNKEVEGKLLRLTSWSSADSYLSKPFSSDLSKLPNQSVSFDSA